MWTVICLMPAALLLAYQIRTTQHTPKQSAPTLADVPVIVLIGEDLEGPL